jgi:hypothetical protein
MAQLPVNFDATQVAPNQAFDPIPAGWYKAHITSTEMKPTAKKDGSFLQVELTILDEKFPNRKVFDQLNLQNPNQTAVDIAYQTLSAICHAVGVFQVNDTQMLHGKPLEVRVGLQPASGDYEARNTVRGYRALEGAGAPSAGAPADAPAWATNPATPPAAAPAATPTPPAAAAPTPPAKFGLEAAVADGWIKHPTSPGWHYKGQDVKSDADVAAMYPAPVAAPTPPATPAAPAAPTDPNTPPWNAGQPPAAAAPAATLPDASAAATAAPPPWAQ